MMIHKPHVSMIYQRIYIVICYIFIVIIKPSRFLILKTIL